MVDYTHTNEVVEAIIAGLSPREGDRILAIAGSGDQAFALIGAGARVSVIDNDSIQIAYVRKRINDIQDGDYSTFDEISSDFGNNSFFADAERRRKIREGLSRLEILDTQCIFDGGIDTSIFDKLYLSNALTYKYNPYLTPFRCAENLSKKMSDGSLIYVTANFEIPFWRGDLRVNRQRTKLARSLEKSGCSWLPMVLEKKRGLLSSYLNQVFN